MEAADPLPISSRIAANWANDAGVAFELRTVPFLLLIHEGLYAPAFVGAGLVVDDPADAVGDEGTVDDQVSDLPVYHRGQGVFGAGV